MKYKLDIERKIGSNRGAARLWIEGKSLLDQGWKVGDGFDAVFAGNSLVYFRNQYNPTRKVAGTATRPIIDTNTNKLLEVANVGDKVRIEIKDTTIMVVL